MDGYVASNITPDSTAARPGTFCEDGGDYDFGPYFLELVQHIDATYRTLTDRRHRATAGLSMGGFMSLVPERAISRPDRQRFLPSIPAPSSTWARKGAGRCGGPRIMSRITLARWSGLIRASGDYISQYHEETRDAYARARRWISNTARTNITATGRHRSARRSTFTSAPSTIPALDNVPEVFSHSDAYRSFAVGGYKVESKREQPAITYLKDVRQGGCVCRLGSGPRTASGGGCHFQGHDRACLSTAGRYTMIDIVWPAAGLRAARLWRMQKAGSSSQ